MAKLKGILRGKVKLRKISRRRHEENIIVKKTWLIKENFKVK